MSVSCEFCELSGRGLCVGLIIHPEESYRLWCVVVCGREASTMRRPWPTGSVEPTKNKLANTWKRRMETTEYLMEERIK